MSGDWFGSGFDALDDMEEERAKSGGSGGDFDKTPRRYWMRDGEKRRIMFLDDNPFCFWEHNTKNPVTGKWDRYTICPRKNGISDDCPDCDNEQWPSFIGYFTVVTLDPVEFKSKKDGKTIRLEWTKRLYGAKAGSTRKPGVLHKLRRLKDRKDGLVGTIWDVYRDGDMSPSIGNDFEFVERVKPEGSESLEAAIRRYAKEEKGVDDELWEKAPWEPYDYNDIFNPEKRENGDRVQEDDVPF